MLCADMFGGFSALISGGTKGGFGDFMDEWYDGFNTDYLRYELDLDYSDFVDFSFDFNDPDLDFAFGKTDIDPRGTLDLTSNSDNFFGPGMDMDSSQAEEIHGAADGEGLKQSADIGTLGPPNFELSDMSHISDPVNVVTGEFYIDSADVSLPGPFPLQIRRNYLSGNLADNSFGHGWKMNLMPYLMMVTNNDGSIISGAAEPDGSVIYYRKQTNDVFLVDAAITQRSIRRRPPASALFSTRFSIELIGLRTVEQSPIRLRVRTEVCARSKNVRISR